MRLTNFAALMDRDNKAMKYFGGGPQNATGERSKGGRGVREEGVFVRNPACMWEFFIKKKMSITIFVVMNYARSLP